MSGSLLRRRNITITSLSIAVMLTVIINSYLFFARIDLTEDKTYSISEVSQNLFLEIDDAVYIEYHLSDKLRSRAVEVEQIADILFQYAAYSRGRITVEVSDPAQLGISQDVEAAGVLPRQIQVIEEDQQSVAVVYSGIVITYLDRSETIPFIIEPATLEYELSSAIRNLVSDQQQVIGILVGDERRTLEQNYRFIDEQFSQLFETEQLFPGEPINDSLSAVVVLGASSLDRTDLYHVDQYLMSGGRIFFAVDAVNVNVEFAFFSSSYGELPIYDVLESYGARIAQSLVADEYNLRVPLQQQGGGNLVIQQLVQYPYWITLLRNSVNSEHPITARFSGLDLFWASPIEPVDDADSRITPLVGSSAESWVIAEEPFYTQPQEALALSFVTDTSNKRTNTLGVIIDGEFQSAFTETPESISIDNPDIRHRADTADGRVIIIGDTDFLGFITDYTRSFYNYTFFQDSVAWLVNDSDLLSIRTRQNRDVRLNALQPEQKERVARAATIFNVVIIPLIIICAGLTRFIRRRKSERLTQNAVSPTASRSSITSNKSSSAKKGRET